MRYFTLVALFLLFQLPTIAAQKGIEFSQQNWNQILITAAKEKKIIFVDGYTDWCQPCKKMDRQVFPQKMVGDFYNKNFINVKLNMEKGIGKELQQKYDVVFYPTFLFITADGTLLHRMAGYQSAPKFLALGKTAVDPSKRLSAFDVRYENGERSPEFLLEYTKIKKAAMDGTHGEIAAAYLDTQKDWNSEKNLTFIFKNMDDTDSRLFDYMVKNKEPFEKKFGVSKVAGKIENLIYQKIYDEKGNASLEVLDELFAKVYSPEQAEKASTRFKMNYFLEKRSSEKYAEMAIAYYEKNPPQDPSELGDVAYNFYELDVSKKKYLKKALKWSKSAIKKDPSFFNYETLAAVYFRMGKKRKARKAVKKAINLAKAKKEDFTETQMLYDKIKDM